MDHGRDLHLLQVFAKLADSLVSDYNVVDVLQTLVDTCEEFLDIDDAGILLPDGNRGLELIAATSESPAFVDLMEASGTAGPSAHSFSTGQGVSIPDMRSANAWGRFQKLALTQGFTAIQALPLRLRDMTIGSLVLLRKTPGTFPPQDLVAAQAFADVATVGVIQERTIRESKTVQDQLQRALDSRIIIEQAKGVVAHQQSISPDKAFDHIRTYARRHHLPLSLVAAQLVTRTLEF